MPPKKNGRSAAMKRTNDRIKEDKARAALDAVATVSSSDENDDHGEEFQPVSASAAARAAWGCCRLALPLPPNH